MFQLFHLYISIAQSSTSLCPKIHLIRSKFESVIAGVKIKCHKCFNMKDGVRIPFTTLTNLIDGDGHTKNGYMLRILLYAFFVG